MATISRFSAVVSVGALKFGGFIGWLAWLGLHLVYVIGFKSRVTTLLHWAVTFIGRGRAQRVYTVQQVLGRRALERIDPAQAPHLPRSRAIHVLAPHRRLLSGPSLPSLPPCGRT
jgi:NADH dehydrogenase